VKAQSASRAHGASSATLVSFDAPTAAAGTVPVLGGAAASWRAAHATKANARMPVCFMNATRWCRSRDAPVNHRRFSRGIEFWPRTSGRQLRPEHGRFASSTRLS